MAAEAKGTMAVESKGTMAAEAKGTMAVESKGTMAAEEHSLLRHDVELIRREEHDLLHHGVELIWSPPAERRPAAVASSAAATRCLVARRSVSVLHMRINVASFAPSPAAALPQVVDASTTSCRPRREQHLLTPLSSEEEHGLLHHDVELIWSPAASRRRQHNLMSSSPGAASPHAVELRGMPRFLHTRFASVQCAS
ncbi:uncharacterized protein LOC124662545 [Lolium rigidum]|uniref:uncharacterized protein LOC124662545 n=1 Tax=Lolium rigidum TaxID=89674 RepID=UPI001F5C5AD1|nr:uncharacterized protein LOC124662545 [Lolium rigidum]